MAIDKPLVSQTYAEATALDDDEPEMDIEVVDEVALEPGIEDTPDGGVVVTFGDQGDPTTGGGDAQHTSNLAEYLSEGELDSIGNELFDSYENDRLTRSDWEMLYTKGIDAMGLKVEKRTIPWENACGVFHPMITEAVVHFQAQSITAMWPASGPCRTQIVGEQDAEVVKQSQRVEQEMNYQLTEVMTEARAEHEMMLFHLPLAGSAFKKIWFDKMRNRAVSMFVPAEDLIVQYGTSDLETAPRVTHVMKRTKNEVKKSQYTGLYREVDLADPVAEYSHVREKKDKVDGTTPSIEEDDRYTLLEVHTELDLPEPYAHEAGIALPYVVTIEKQSRKVLSIYRNWEEGDESFEKRQYFTHYSYVPGWGFYGIGLIHLIGGLAESATSILRQLIDAGTLANLRGGFKSKGLRVEGDNTPLYPGEWRDVDATGGTIKDSIFPLPYQEPSQVLVALLTMVVDEGRRIGSIADLTMNLSSSGQAPVGTILALLERNLKVVTAIQARMHASYRKELRMISDIIGKDMPPKYEYALRGKFDRHQDFSSNVDVLPVSDPNASTMAQRVIQYQAALQLAQQAPQNYNLARLHRQMIETLGIPNADKIVPMEEEIMPADPVTENMNIIMQKPVKAYLHQNHEAHIAVHLAAAEDPQLRALVGQSPFAQAIESSMAAHIAEHIAYQYRREIEEKLGVSLGDPEQPMPQDVEYDLSKALADAAQQVLAKSQNEAARKQAEEEAKNPLTQMQLKELEIREKEVDNKAMTDRARIDLEKMKLDIDASLRKAKLDSDERVKGTDMGVRLVTAGADLTAKERAEGARLGQKIASDISKDKREKEIAEKQLAAKRNAPSGE